MTVSDSTARDLLAAADDGDRNGDSLARTSRGAAAGYSIAIGVLVALFLLGVVYIFPLGSALLSIATTVAYAVLVMCAVLVFYKVRKASPRGWGKLYGLGFGVTMALYVAGVVIAVSTGWANPLFWIAYSLVVALPVAIMGSMTGKR